MTPKPGEIWKEADKRFTRYVKIIRVDADAAIIQTCDERGTVLPRTRQAPAMLSRFGKVGGYRLFKEAP